MKKIIFLILFTWINFANAGDENIELNSNINNISTCIFISNEQNSDGISIYQNLSFICSDDIHYNIKLLNDGNIYHGELKSNQIHFKIGNRKENILYFNENFLVVY